MNEDISVNPGALLDALMVRLRVKNDAQLSRALEIPQPIISKLRYFRTAITASLLIKMHECTGLSIAELRLLMGDQRKNFRVVPIQKKGIGTSVQNLQTRKITQPFYTAQENSFEQPK